MTEAKKISSADLRGRWTKFTDHEAGAIKDTEALSTQVMKSYGLQKDKAEAEVTAWAAGRTF